MEEIFGHKLEQIISNVFFNSFYPEKKNPPPLLRPLLMILLNVFFLISVLRSERGELKRGKLAKKRDFKAYWNIVLKGIWKQTEKAPDQQAEEVAEVISESVIHGYFGYLPEGCVWDIYSFPALYYYWPKMMKNQAMEYKVMSRLHQVAFMAKNNGFSNHGNKCCNVCSAVQWCMVASLKNILSESCIIADAYFNVISM